MSSALNISKERLNPETIDEIEIIEEEEKKGDTSKMVYKEYNKTYGFRKSKTMHVFGNEIINNIINIYMATDEQNHLAKYVKESKTKQQNNSNLKKVKEDISNSAVALLKWGEMVCKAFCISKCR